MEDGPPAPLVPSSTGTPLQEVPMKLLWVSNAPWAHSGYGSQTRQVGRRIAASGVEIEFAANDGTRGNRRWEGFSVLGSGMDQYSRDVVAEDIARSGADWTVALFDPWVYVQTGDPFRGNERVMGWVPVDHFPAAPSMIPWLQAHPAIAMSQFGFATLAAASGELEKATGKGLSIRYAPHAVEPVFRPTPTSRGFGDRSFREVIGIPPDAFVVGIVAANTGGTFYDRKGFGDMAQALSVFLAAHPDAYVYLHTLQFGHQGINLPILLNVANVPADRVIWADQYLLKKSAIRDEDMAAIYSALDVLLATSRGEGFGLPVLEAQACGVPVIASNWTAQAELVGEPWSPDRPGAQRWPSGWLVSVQPDYDDKHASFFAKPNLLETVAALEESYRLRGDVSLREAAVAKAAGWAADTVFRAHWAPILAEMREALGEKPVVNLALKKRKGRAA